MVIDFAGKITFLNSITLLKQCRYFHDTYSSKAW